MNELIKNNNNNNNNDDNNYGNDKQNDYLDDLEKIKTTNDLINNFTKNCLEVNKNVNKRIRNKTLNLSRLNVNDTNLSSSESVIYESSTRMAAASKTRKPIKRLNTKHQQSSKQLPHPLTTEEWSEYINKGDIIQVNCNSIVGELHKNKFGSGGKGKSIYVNSVDQWMTPIQFEKFCGKSNCKDWKRSIKFGGEQIYKLFDDNVLMCHALSCSCAICSDDGKVIGPIRPFERKRRRKGPEIQAQNAFKKFLCLRPPTLLSSEPLINRIERIQNNNSNSCGNTNSNTSGVVANNFRNDETANNAVSFNNSNSSSFSNDLVPHPSSGSSLKYIEKLENDQWTLLEKAADMLISQAKNLKNLIEQAKNQSFIAKKSLSNDKLKNKINQFFNNNMNNSMNNSNLNVNYTKGNYDNNNEDDGEDESIDDNDDNDEDGEEETEDNEYDYANRIGQS